MRPDDNETRFDLVPYFHGKILDISEGRSRAFPHFISHIELGIDEPHKVDMLADKSIDGILSSNLLHLFDTEDCKKAVEAWRRIVRPGGHIMIHLPISHEKERWSVSYETIVELMEFATDMVFHKENQESYLSVFRL